MPDQMLPGITPAKRINQPEDLDRHLIVLTGDAQTPVMAPMG